MQYNTIQYNKLQYDAIQYNKYNETVDYNKMQCYFGYLCKVHSFSYSEQALTRGSLYTAFQLPTIRTSPCQGLGNLVKIVSGGYISNLNNARFFERGSNFTTFPNVTLHHWQWWIHCTTAKCDFPSLILHYNVTLRRCHSSVTLHHCHTSITLQHHHTIASLPITVTLLSLSIIVKLVSHSVTATLLSLSITICYRVYILIRASTDISR